jgi:hypothetical protein
LEAAKRYLAKPGNRTARAEYTRKRNQWLKDMVYDHYGRKCACCGESEPMFLSIDHIGNDGYELRKSGKQGKGAGVHLYGWLIRNDFPAGYQVLCMNCNHGKSRNGGICPHQSRKCNDYPEGEYAQASGSARQPSETVDDIV